jgi:hypothetical protein
VVEQNAVRLESADHHHLSADGYRWAQVDQNFSNIESAINYLCFCDEKLIAARSVFRIVDLSGTVLLEDGAIRSRVRPR